jgi:phage-related protein
MDTGGFNKGIGKIGTAMKGLGAVLGKIVIGVTVAFAAIVLVLAAIVRGLITMAKAMFEVGQTAGKYAAKVEELKSSFASLKMALIDAFRPLILAALPWIQQVVSWVQVLLSLVAQVMAGLTGQAGYWKTTATAAGGAADATAEVAKNTKKAGEAAEGALAAFDDLNVLQEEDTSPTGGGGGAGISQEWVPLGEKAIGIIEKIKAAWAEVVKFFEPLAEPLKRIWEAFGRIWENVKKAALSLWEDLTPAFEWFRDNVLQPILEALATLFEKIASWNEKEMKAALAGLILAGALILLLISPVAQVIAIIAVLITIIGLLIKYWPEISAAATDAWEWVKAAAIDAWEKIVETWEKAKEWFQTTVIDPIKNAWNTALNTIKNAFTRIFGSIKNTVTGIINDIIGLINDLISGIISGINKVIDLYNKLPGKDVGLLSTPQIPLVGGNYRNVPFFASGAVIPPNAAFLAMLGDQRNGMNIEAPEELIRQIVREESGSSAVTINFAGSLGALVRELKPFIDKENNRIGRSLVKGAIS